MYNYNIPFYYIVKPRLYKWLFILSITNKPFIKVLQGKGGPCCADFFFF